MVYIPVDIEQAVKRECRRRRYSERTIKTYLYCINRFLKFAGKPINRISKRDVRLFLESLSEREMSGNTMNVYHMAIRFLFEDILDKRIWIDIKYSKVPEKLPVVLSKEEVKKLFSVIGNTKHKLMVQLMYSAGLRVSELINLKINDIELDKSYGWVRGGKGGKDRLFIVADSLKDELEKSISSKTSEWLFTSQNGRKYNMRSLQQIIKKAGKNAGIKKTVSCHTLRHSFATHLIEDGYSVSEVQSLLGHKNPETTFVYLHTASPSMIKIKSPLDNLQKGDKIGEIKPMLAELGSREDLKRKDLIFEPKVIQTGLLDGTRALAYKKDNSITIVNRRGVILNRHYPELLEIVKNIKDNATVDGEIVVMDKSGKPNFYRLAEREHVDSSLRIEILSKEIPATYVVFDILSVDNKNLTNLPLLERKKILKEVVSESKKINLCFYTENGEELFKVVKRQKLEGVMGKIKDSLYFPGERKDCWLKIKYLKTLDTVIAGFTKGSGWREPYFGALILGCYHQGKLKYVGRAGTGLNEEGYAELTEILQKLKTDKCPFEKIPEFPSGIIPVWVKPKLVCEVRLMNLSKDLIMRVPSYIRLRDDKNPEDCILEV